MDYRKQGYRPSALPRRIEPASPSIMQSLDSISLMEQSRPMEDRNWEGCRDNRPDITLTAMIDNLHFDDKNCDANSCFLLIDGNEYLQVSSAEHFLGKLSLATNEPKVKVVSIFGNTGDGKSHALNHIFFNGNEMFPTSAAATSSTMGVWAAYDPVLHVICLDTEGLLGSTDNENQRTRMLLKVLAVSDVIIYRTRAERLHHDLFTFLSAASQSYTQHFQNTLQRVGLSTSLSSLGPGVIVFHETKHTKPLQSRGTMSADECLRERFSKLSLEIDAFSSMRYIGIQTGSGMTDFTKMKAAVYAELRNTSVRSSRPPSVIFNTLKILNDRFSGELLNDVTPFSDQYFTCPDECLCCKKRCQASMGHLKDNLPHSSSMKCVYQSQYDNYVYLCKKCHGNGIKQIVTQKPVSSDSAPWYGIVKYVWSGYTIECPTCGELYTSRSYWYGNRPPEDCQSVRTEIAHIWPGSEAALATQNTAQRVLDGVSFLSDAVVGAVAQPTKIIGSYVADQIAPRYWRPNNQITHCEGCKTVFPPTAKKHHCRNCGEGFCEPCSSQTARVPSHGWYEPVRVCVSCHDTLEANQGKGAIVDPTEIRVRKYGEIVANTLSSVATVLDYPKEFIKDSARPSYWKPDSEISACCVCDMPFDAQVTLHHCRDCGQGVCDPCSTRRKPVPHRGWDKPVRVCDDCHKVD